MSPKRGSSLAVAALVLAGAAVAGGFVFRRRTLGSGAAPAAAAAAGSWRRESRAGALALASASATGEVPSGPAQRSAWDRAAAVTVERSGGRGAATAVAFAPRASSPGRPMPPSMPPAVPTAGALRAPPRTPAELQRARTVQRIEDDPRVAPYLAASYNLHLDDDRRDKLLALLMANSRPQPFAGGATESQPATLDTPEGIRAHEETERRLEPSLRALIGPAKTSELLTMVTFEQLQRRPPTPRIHGAR